MKTDKEIARSSPKRPIAEIAAGLGIPPERLYPYGSYVAKVDSRLLRDLDSRPDGRLILVTAMSPTPAGEGKTTLAIGLSDSFKLLGKKVMACLRQPSLGPVFGAKGGATGGGLAQVLPPEEITFQFTGDDYAILTAHNLISSVIDNHIYHGNKLGIDPGRILWKRLSTVNDRALRSVRVSIGKVKGERQEEFHISAASEVMSILCLARDLSDLKERIGRALVAFTFDGTPVTVADLKVKGAAAALMRNAIHPNLVQTIEGVPVFVHGGPFGNISIGCSSLIATKTALKLSDYVLTEAGFATELGAEKFFDIKCRTGSIKPSAVVIVSTLNALRFHGGSADFKKNDTPSALKGVENLKKHIENIRRFKVPAIVAINRYEGDSDAELSEAVRAIGSLGVRTVITDVFGQGGKGGLEAASAAIEACEGENGFSFLYPLASTVKDKVSVVSKEMYGAQGVIYTEDAEKELEEIERLGYGELPVCVAKTPKSLSDNPALTGRPEGFSITVRSIRPSIGAGYLVAICGNVLLMPGLPEHPLAERMDVDDDGNITGA